MGASSRRSDPPSSVDAARLVEGNGSAAVHRRKLIKIVNEFPYQTYAEYASMTGIDPHEVARRLPELRPTWITNDGESRRCRVKGTMMMTWAPVTEAEPQGTLKGFE